VTFEGASDFLDTFVVTAVELRDGAQAPVIGASLASESGTAYPGVGAVTTTTTTLVGGTTTTTQPPGCTGLSGLPHAACLLEAAALAPLCGDTIPAAVARSLTAKLSAARKVLGRAIDATGRKQAKLVKGAGRMLGALAARATAAAKAKNSKKQISPACEAAIHGLADAATLDLS
jgi:hypothetical protein